MTNGEKIEEIFPNVEISPDPYSPSVDICVGGIMMMRVDRNWWNAEYKEPTTKNDLGVDCISRQAVDSLVGEYLRRTTDETIAFYEHFLDLPSVTPQEPRWISVSERYPKIEDEYKYFLVTDDKGKVSVQEFFISLDEEPQPYFSGMVNIIAWMPLPKAYKTESEDKE